MFDKNQKEVLKKALKQYQFEYLEDYRDEKYADIVVTDELNEKINELIKKRKTPHYFTNRISKKIAVVIMILFIAITTTVVSVDALRETISDFFVEIYEQFSLIVFEEDKNESEFENIQIHLPNYIPNGYKMTVEEVNNLSVFCEYKNENDILIFEQSIVSGMQIGIDTENTYVETIFIDDGELLYYENKNEKSIIFYNDSYSYMISGKISKEELIKIAQSISFE